MRAARVAMMGAIALFLAFLPGTGRACTVLDVVGCAPSPSPTPQQPRPEGAAGAERLLLQAINRSRAAHGLAPLAPDARAIPAARGQALAMARRGDLFHNPWLASDAAERAFGHPSQIGENVGDGPDARSLARAFMDSPRHRRQILSSAYRSVGVGVTVRAGWVWVSEVFLGRTSPGAHTMRVAVAHSTSATVTAPAVHALGMAPRASQSGLPHENAFPWLAATGGLALAGAIRVVRYRKRSNA